MSASSRGRSTQDIAAGAVIVALAVAALVVLAKIPTAKFQTIGPDLFPRLCAYGLVAGGIALVVRGFLRKGVRLERVEWRGMLLVVAGIVAFGLIAPRFGYAVGGFATVVISGFATREVTPGKLVVFACVLIAFSVALFTFVLKVPMPAFNIAGIVV